MTCPHCGKNIDAALRKIAAKGGKASTDAKVEAARLNGKKGGRPKGRKRTPPPLKSFGG